MNFKIWFFLVDLQSILDTGPNSVYWELGSPRKNQLNWRYGRHPLILMIKYSAYNEFQPQTH